MDSGNQSWKNVLEEEESANILAQAKQDVGNLGRPISWEILNFFKKKINWIVRKLMRTLWDVHSDSHKSGIFWNEQNTRTVYHLLEKKERIMLVLQKIWK